MPKTQFVRNLINRLPLPSAMGLAVAMFLSPSVSLANTITAFPSWEVGSEFNDNANPSGVWSYGTKTTLTAIFALATVPDTVNAPDVLGWTTSSGFPAIAHNVHPTPFLTSVSVLLPPHSLGMHPGPGGEYAAVRFTAPAKGTYKVSGQFYALDNNGTGTITDVWVLQNNSTSPPVFSGNVNYYGGLRFASFTSTLFRLRLGDTLDFQVGYGTDFNYAFDSTGLNAVIERIR